MKVAMYRSKASREVAGQASSSGRHHNVDDGMRDKMIDIGRVLRLYSRVCTLHGPVRSALSLQLSPYGNRTERLQPHPQSPMRNFSPM